MKNIHKIANMALIFMLIGVFLCRESAYGLRPALQTNSLSKGVQSFLNDTDEKPALIEDLMKKADIEDIDKNTELTLTEIFEIEKREGLREKIVFIIKDMVTKDGESFGLAAVSYLNMLIKETKESKIIREGVIEVLYNQISTETSPYDALSGLLTFFQQEKGEDERLDILDICDRLLKQKRPVGNMLSWLTKIYQLISERDERKIVSIAIKDIIEKRVDIGTSIFYYNLEAIYGTYKKVGLKQSQDITLTPEERMVCIMILHRLILQEATRKKLSDTYMKDFIYKYVNLVIPEFEGVDLETQEALDKSRNLSYFWWYTIEEGKDPLELAAQMKEEFQRPLVEAVRGERGKFGERKREPDMIARYIEKISSMPLMIPLISLMTDDLKMAFFIHASAEEIESHIKESIKHREELDLKAQKIERIIKSSL